MWPLWRERPVSWLCYISSSSFASSQANIQLCAWCIGEEDEWMMLENMHGACGPTAPPPPPSLLAFCVRVWSCVLLFLSLGDSPDASLCVWVWERGNMSETDKTERDRGSKSIPAWLHTAPFSALLQAAAAALQSVHSGRFIVSCAWTFRKDRQSSNKPQCVFVGVSLKHLCSTGL